MDRKHIFFKFGPDNIYFNNIYNVSKNKLFYKFDNSEVHDVWLAVFYDNFLFKDFPNLVGSPKNSNNRKKNELHHTQYKEVDLFFNKSKSNCIYWIMTNGNIFALEPQDDKIYNGGDIRKHNSLIEIEIILNKLGNTIFPKFRKFKLIKIFDRFDPKLPEIFLTTDSSGIHGTLMELKNKRKVNADIAEAALGTKIKPSTFSELFHYLSPTQLETFLYKLFDSNDYIVSSIRGGPRSLIDLYIYPNNKLGIGKFSMNKKNGILIQVKRDISFKDAKLFLDQHNEIFLFTLENFSTFYSNLSPKQAKFLIDYNDIHSLLQLKDSAATLKWLKCIMGDQCFDYKNLKNI